MLFRRCSCLVPVLAMLLAACAQTHGLDQQREPSNEGEGDGDAGQEQRESSTEMDASDSDPLDATPQGILDGAVRVDGAPDADGALGPTDSGASTSNATDGALDQMDSATSTPDADVEDGGGPADDRDAAVPDAGTAPQHPKDPPAPDDTFPTSNILDVVTEPGGPNCTIYRPEILGPNGRKHPVIVWTNGQYEVSSLERSYGRLAAMGFIVSVVNPSASPSLSCEGQGEEIYECLEYVLRENENGSLRGKVDVERLGLVGYSLGACDALRVGQDELFGASAVIEPLIFSGETEFVGMQRGPAFLATSWSGPALNSHVLVQIFESASPVVWGRYNESGASASAEELLEYVPHWFRYKLMNDPWGSQWFRKIACKLCDEDWFVQWNPNWVE